MAHQSEILSTDLLERAYQRAPAYDQEHRFFQEDFDELKAVGFLTIAVPKELGGRGSSLEQVCQEQETLAYYAPATALGVNMHLYWTGVAADLWRAGDTSLQWLLEEAANGAIFAAGHAETGNDIPVLLSTTRAERANGGYRFTGRKAFGSLTPVWTYLGLHGMDTSNANAPKVVHAFMPRSTKGFTIHETWDVLGMRATRSDDTALDGAFVSDRYIARIVPAGFAGVDRFVLAIFAWALLGFASVYYGLAQRAFDLTVAEVKKRKAIALSRPLAYHAGIQHSIAEMALELEAIGPHIERITRDWSEGVDHGHGWATKIFAAKHHAVQGAWKVADLALDTAGGFGIFRRSGIERLLRDARLGRIHPANTALTHEIVAKLTLGISPDEMPRWG